MTLVRTGPGWGEATDEGPVHHAHLYDFDVDGATLKEAHKQYLRGRVLNLLKLDSTRVATVTGNASRTGDKDHNTILSTQRAKAVITFVRDEGGIDLSRMSLFGAGSDAASAPGENPRARSVDVDVTPKPTAPMPTPPPPASATIRPPTSSELDTIKQAETARGQALPRALARIDAFLAKSGDSGEGAAGAPNYSGEDQQVIDAVRLWLYVPDVNEKFWATLRTARGLIAQNQAISPLRYSVDTAKTDAFAYVYSAERDKGIFLCLSSFFPVNEYCQREVLLHEYFHFLGLGHFYSTSDTAEALQCAHHMAELVYDIATGCIGGCSGTSCRAGP
jgi:hypothetical protein